MTTISTKNFIGVKDQTIKVADETKSVWVFGNNHTGKSSAAMGIIGALAGTADPLRLGVRSLRNYIYEKARLGGVEIRQNDGSLLRSFLINVSGSSPEVATDGDMAAQSLAESGGIRFDRLTPNELRHVMVEALGLIITNRDELVEAVDNALDEDRVIARDEWHANMRDNGDEITKEYENNLRFVIENPSNKSWDSASKSFADKARELKGAWQDKTGQKWGERVSKDWMPETHFSPGIPLEQRIQRVRAEKDSLSEKLGSIKSLKEARRFLDDYERMDIEKAKARLAQAKDAGRMALSKRKAYREEAVGLKKSKLALESRIEELVNEYNSIRVLTCPHCDGKVQPDRERHALVAATDENTNRAKEINLLHKEAKKQVKALGEKLEAIEGKELAEDSKVVAISDDVKSMLSQIEAGEKAEKLYAKMKDVVESSGTYEEEEKIIEKRDKLEAEEGFLKEDIESILKWDNASAIDGELRVYLSLSKAFGANGIRAELMNKVMHDVSAAMKEVTRTTSGKWPHFEWGMETGLGMETKSGSFREIKLCSESEKWMGHSTLLMTLASLKGTRVAVLDGADILDSEGRIGLAMLLDRRTSVLDALVIVFLTGKSPGGAATFEKTIHGAQVVEEEPVSAV